MGGLAICANINGPGPSPTFYITIAPVGSIPGAYNYYYYNGTGWTNTGHTSSAVNIAGGGGYIYGLVGNTGEVFRYDGTGNTTLLTTVPGFAGQPNGNGTYDLSADCADGGVSSTALASFDTGYYCGTGPGVPVSA